LLERGSNTGVNQTVNAKPKIVSESITAASGQYVFAVAALKRAAIPLLHRNNNSCAFHRMETILQTANVAPSPYRQVGKFE